MHGAGKITTPEGKEITGTWVNGEYKWPTNEAAGNNNSINNSTNNNNNHNSVNNNNQN